MSIKRERVLLINVACVMPYTYIAMAHKRYKNISLALMWTHSCFYRLYCVVCINVLSCSTQIPVKKKCMHER